MQRIHVPPTYDTSGRSNILSPMGRESKKGVEDALSCTSAHAWDNYSPPVELRMTFRFPSSDHHTLRMSFLSRVMLNVWNLQNIHMMCFCTKNCSFHSYSDVYNVSLGWGKCTGDNSYDQLAQDFLAGSIIRFWGCFSKPSWKQWLGRVAIPSSVGLVLSSCHSSGVKWPRNNP